MKQFFVSLLLCWAALATPTLAQAQPANLSTEEVLTTLSRLPLFVQYRNFKGDLQKQTIELAARPGLTMDEYVRLRTAYTSTQEKYNFFLNDIKSDLSRYATIQKMLKYSATFAARYSDNYAEVVTHYNDTYKPVAESIKGNGSKSTLVISPQIVIFGLETFVEIVNWLKNRRQLQNEMVEMLLPIINQYFYNELRMKDWSELGTTPPADMGSAPGTGSTPRTGIMPAPIPAPTVIHVPAPVLNEIKGSITFLQTAPVEKKMAFERAGGSKNLTVVDDKQQTSLINGIYFRSVESHPAGTRFRIKAEGSAFVYVIALNEEADGSQKAEFLYPGVKVNTVPSVGALNPATATNRGKNLTVVSDAMPAPSTSMLLPSATSSIQIDAKKSQEDFCILLSKSELVPAEVINKLQACTGSLYERVAQAFGTQSIKPEQAGITTNGDTFSYSVSDSQFNVLPLVFVIRK